MKNWLYHGIIILVATACGAPSENEVLSKITLPRNCHGIEEVSEIKIGKKQSYNCIRGALEPADACIGGGEHLVEWYPVRVSMTSNCIGGAAYNGEGITPEELRLLSNSKDMSSEEWRVFFRKREENIRKHGERTSITMHYRFQKNEYGEWRAFSR